MNVVDELLFDVASCVHYNHDYRKSPLALYNPAVGGLNLWRRLKSMCMGWRQRVSSRGMWNMSPRWAQSQWMPDLFIPLHIHSMN